MKVFEYIDYRKFVADAVGARGPGSLPLYKALRKVGITNPSFINKIVRYGQNISIGSARKIARLFDMNQEESAYFIKLVEFNQETDPGEKRTIAKSLLKFKGLKKHAPLTLDKFEYFSSWLNVVVLEFVSIGQVPNDLLGVAARLRGLVSEDELRRSVALLERLGLIERVGKKFRATQAVIHSGDEISDLFIENHYEQFSKAAIESLKRDPIESREFVSLTFGVSRKDVAHIKRAIIEFRDEIIRTYGQPRSPEIVFEILIEAFPLSD